MRDIDARVRLLKHDFLALVSGYDVKAPFRRSGQLGYHRRTILARRSAGSAAAALGDDEFLSLLHLTLQKWGIGARGSRLLPPEEFASALRRSREEIVALDQLSIDDPSLDVSRTSRRLMGIIERLGIVDNKAPVVACTKALHHLLPDLVVPIDREYTQTFFGWSNPKFQYGQRECFTQAFRAFADVACDTNPQQYVRETGWHTSRTKVIDNAIVALLVGVAAEAKRGAG